MLKKPRLSQKNGFLIKKNVYLGKKSNKVGRKQRRTQNSVKHLRWRFFTKWFSPKAPSWMLNRASSMSLTKLD